MLPQSNREKEIFRVTLIGSIVNFSLLIFKFVAGIVGHSAAMVADAVHSSLLFGAFNCKSFYFITLHFFTKLHFSYFRDFLVTHLLSVQDALLS